MIPSSGSWILKTLFTFPGERGLHLGEASKATKGHILATESAHGNPFHMLVAHQKIEQMCIKTISANCSLAKEDCTPGWKGPPPQSPQAAESCPRKTGIDWAILSRVH